MGKTSICMRFCDDFFASQYKQTIGVDFMSKKLSLPGAVNVTLQIWDIGGQSLGSKMIKNYIFGAHAVILAYDITNFQSFQDLDDWLDLVHATFKPDEMPYMALFGNKGIKARTCTCTLSLSLSVSFSFSLLSLPPIAPHSFAWVAVDLQHLRTVKLDKHAQFCEKHHAAGYFVSAKTGDNLNGVFLKIAADLSGVQITKGQLDSQQVFSPFLSLSLSLSVPLFPSSLHVQRTL